MFKSNVNVMTCCLVDSITHVFRLNVNATPWRMEDSIVNGIRESVGWRSGGILPRSRRQGRGEANIHSSKDKARCSPQTGDLERQLSVRRPLQTPLTRDGTFEAPSTGNWPYALMPICFAGQMDQEGNRERASRRKQSGNMYISTLGVVAKKLCFLQTPSKNEQNQQTKKKNNMPRTVKCIPVKDEISR